ncbi:PadR family transcriptional regulator [Propioniciclava tarda]|uniref:PadR family transcriptional regulator n=1 Tax=Propioniciclava tarda TaxID=433330 RepID=A0A4Q9KIK2_PROTD|nr:PadR family transcriptional regulator [Propioniciclava tarda]TBT94227.1 PadR family transcriptional regulator [Propioniciclava tarda]SMO75171.1 DNA-binding transcriptional regulator, PadR family [Propioniciclava tarda]HQD22393.1 PadR family transcriptional regulator [Arachnia sp.]
MSIKYGLLAILDESPAYGYQLKTEFERRTASAWPLNIGQVYTTLDRLSRDGLVTPLDPTDDTRTYAITPAGRAELKTWFTTPIEQTTPPRNDLAIKLALAASTHADLTAIIQAQRTATMRTLQHYTLAKRQADASDTAWLMVVELMIFTAEAEIRWLDHCEGLASRPTPTRSDAPAAVTAPAQSKDKAVR